jgi:hypothetical protein
VPELKTLGSGKELVNMAKGTGRIGIFGERGENDGSQSGAVIARVSPESQAAKA